MHRALFITGTGTGVGKTVITAGLLRWLRHGGVDAVSMKPVQTGAERRGEKLIAPDLQFHWEAGGLTPQAEEQGRMAPYLYEPACSPHLAGRLAGFCPEIAHIAQCAEALLARHEMLLVEGAGGVLVPLNEQHTMRDLMAALGFPVLLVALAGLGTINHTLLSLEGLNNAGITTIGIVLNEATAGEDPRIIEDNRDTLARLGGLPVWGPLAYNKCLTAPSDADWQAFDRALSQMLHEVSGR